jgi:hypothetical protein
VRHPASEGIVDMTLSKVRGVEFALAALGTMLLAGCAGDGASTAAAGGANCAAVKSQLSDLDRKGVQAYVEAQSRGKKLPPAQKTQADNYNRLLNEYLGARCHVVADGR